MVRLVVATPTRGLVHSRMVEAVWKNISLTGVVFSGWVFSHDLPIPDSHEYVCSRALETDADLIWLVEEDVQPPPNALRLLMDVMSERNADGAFMDYPIGQVNYPTSNCAQVLDGYCVWCGTGCLLLSRRVLEGLPLPRFRNQNEVEVKIRDGEVKIREYSCPYSFGGQDIWFSLQTWFAGFRIAYVPPEVAICKHLKLQEPGKLMSNNGIHEIVKLPYPTRWHEEVNR